MKGKVAEFLKSIKKEYTVSSVIIIVLGIILAFFPDNSTRLLCYLVAAFFALIGTIVIVRYVKAQQHGALASTSLVAGILIALLGLYIFIKPHSFASMLWIVLGIVLVVDGVYKIMHAVSLGKNGAKNWWTVLIVAAVTTLFGLIIILNAGAVSRLFVRLIGVALIIDGIADLFSTVYLSKVIKKLSTKVIDLELIETEE